MTEQRFEVGKQFLSRPYRLKMYTFRSALRNPGLFFHHFINGERYRALHLEVLGRGVVISWRRFLPAKKEEQ